ncbi:hypothetical protein CXQ82_27495 [Pseudomonas sp. S09G 359]|nr:hypothetical protein CXQ82_27495 [Pseudomonas sp. S09G 359]
MNGDTVKKWERACSRKRRVSHCIGRLSHCIREQARSHMGAVFFFKQLFGRQCQALTRHQK